ncbi:MAG: ISKra4 family transposase [Synergistaceae bacterium]|nr:ISKra4 family transposase [Synergistaceae bacterium]
MASGDAVTLLEIERGFRDAALRGGNILFTKFLSEMKDTAPICPVCATQAPMVDLGVRNKRIVSLLGEGTISRTYFGCGCGQHRLPKDELLDIENTSFTPGVRRVVSQLAACDSFERSSETLEEVCGIYVCSKDTERIAEAVGAAIESNNVKQIEEVFSLTETKRPTALPVPIMYIEYDGTGVPVMKRETSGRKGKQEDGTAKTREAKLGCIFTQTGLNDKGEPVRDKNSTTYFGAIETSDEFGKRLYMEALQRGVTSAKKVVVLGDGAKWIWNLADDNFPGAVQIVDLYHAKEHIYDFIKDTFSDEDTRGAKNKEWGALLEEGKIQELTAEMTRYAGIGEEAEERLEREVNYFKDNTKRMQYGDFKKQGLFVGSGVIEAGCKNVIGKRLKQSGMHWSVRGANAITSLRCSILSGEFKLPKLKSKPA